MAEQLTRTVRVDMRILDIVPMDSQELGVWCILTDIPARPPLIMSTPASINSFGFCPKVDELESNRLRM